MSIEVQSDKGLVCVTYQEIPWTAVQGFIGHQATYRNAECADIRTFFTKARRDNADVLVLPSCCPQMNVAAREGSKSLNS